MTLQAQQHSHQLQATLQIANATNHNNMPTSTELPATKHDILNLIFALRLTPLSTIDPIPQIIIRHLADKPTPPPSPRPSLIHTQPKLSRYSLSGRLHRRKHINPGGENRLRWICCVCATGQSFADGDSCAGCATHHAGCTDCGRYLRAGHGVVGLWENGVESDGRGIWRVK